MIDPIYLEIGDRIRTRRREWHMSANALSLKTHLPIGRIEMGLEEIPLTALFRIARALQCSVSSLLEDERTQ